MNSQPPDRFKVASAFWTGITHLGLTPARVLQQSRLPASIFSENSAVVSTDQFFSLWHAVEALSSDPAAGLKIGSFPGTGSYHPLLIAALHSRNYRDALCRMARYKQFCSPEEMRIAETKDECAIDFVWTNTTQDEPRLLTDAAFAVVLQLGRNGTGAAISPKRVELARTLEPSRAHEKFFGCPVKYRSARNAIVLHRSDLDRAFLTHNAELLEMLQGQFDQQAEDRAASVRTVDRVKWILKRLLAGNRPDIGTVARELGMSSRTLQRKITDEGASFRQVLMEARKELVREYLRQPSLGITEAAYLLGYDDPNSFFRAFRSWEGTTPAHWRATRPLSSAAGDN